MTENNEINTNTVNLTESRKRPAPAAAVGASNHEGCAFWLEKKKRFCKTTPWGDVQYCGIHENQLQCEKKTAASRPLGSPVKTAVIDLIDSTVEQSGEGLEQTAALDRPEPKPDRCNYWLERKRRYCQTRVTSDRLLCVEHSPLTNVRRLHLSLSRIL